MHPSFWFSRRSASYFYLPGSSRNGFFGPHPPLGIFSAFFPVTPFSCVSFDFPQSPPPLHLTVTHLPHRLSNYLSSTVASNLTFPAHFCLIANLHISIQSLPLAHFTSCIQSFRAFRLNSEVHLFTSTLPLVGCHVVSHMVEFCSSLCPCCFCCFLPFSWSTNHSTGAISAPDGEFCLDSLIYGNCFGNNLLPFGFLLGFWVILLPSLHHCIFSPQLRVLRVDVLRLSVQPCGVFQLCSTSRTSNQLIFPSLPSPL